MKKHRIFFTFIILLSIVVVAYCLLWAFSFKHYNLPLGISYSPEYAEYLGLDWKKTYTEMLSDLKPSYVRIAAPWSIVEPENGKYDFKNVDFLISEAQKNNTKIILVVGQKSPRWPECYIPKWTETLSAADKKKAILDYGQEVVSRYGKNSALEFWQVENEPFIDFTFGSCQSFDRTFTQDESSLVQKMDPSHPVIITDSGELSTYYNPSKTGNILGTTLYRTVRFPGGMIWKYDWVPPAYYKLKARIWGKDYEHFFVSELQAEPWFSDATQKSVDLPTKDETFDPSRFVQNISYAQHVGASRAYLWGVEWWYWMKVKNNDSSYWETAKAAIKNSK